MCSEYCIREAKSTDFDTLVVFTLEEAWEAEGAEKDVDAVKRGVRSGLEDPALATYWVAESTGGRVIASISAVKEWSDWHGGYYWWIQSLFILPEHRRRGLVGLLLDKVAEEAEAAGAVDLRLYAHNSNRRALAVYRRCGFNVAPYTIMTRRLTDG